MSGMYLQGYWYRIQSWSDGEETVKGVQVSMAARGNSQVYDGASKRGISGPGTSRRRTSPGGTEGTGNSDYWNPRKQLLGVESLLLDLN
jgi:hypothetical protein